MIGAATSVGKSRPGNVVAPATSDTPQTQSSTHTCDTRIAP